MIKRRIFDGLWKHLSADQMTVIIGPRQVGKTYLMNELRKRLEEEGGKSLWFNLDNEEDKKRFVSQADLLAYIELRVGRERAVVFIDEIQRKENAGLFLKGIYDMNTPYKLVVSGSGSLELKAKIPESMAGRKRLFSVSPVGFEEFVDFRTSYQYEGRLLDFFRLEEERVGRLLKEYMVFGGYPRVVLAKTVDLKQGEMQEIYRSYVDRDIHDLLHLEKTDAFNNLLKILASQIGSLVNVTELATTVGIDQKTVKHYLWYLEQTFVLKKVTPYFRNIRSEVTKAPIYYFVDIGLRNWLLGLFGLPEIPPPLGGHLFENLVYLLLAEKVKMPATVHFWRTQDGAEVDLVIDKGEAVVPVEVKFKKIRDGEISRSLRSFIRKYQPKKAYVVHLGERGERRVDNSTVEFVPVYDLESVNEISG